jgi:BASS family bile acid:Na+ symporter
MTKIAISIKVGFKRLFRHTGFILTLAVILGLVYNRGAFWTKHAVTPILLLVMTLPMLSISTQIFKEFRKLLLPIFLAIVLSFIVLGGTFIGLSILLINDRELWTGFVLIASVPPAVAVVPYTYHLGGNTSLSLVGSVAAYFSALIVTPLFSISFLGTSFIEPVKLMVILGELIVAPLIFSRIIRLSKVLPALEKHRGIAVNWGFFIVVYTIIGLNRDAFLGQPLTLLRVSVIAFASTFILAYLINYVAKAFGMSKPDRLSLILLGTRKNYGLAAAVSLTFFGSRAAVPTAVAMAFAIAQFIWLTFTVKKMG